MKALLNMFCWIFIAPVYLLGGFAPFLALGGLYYFATRYERTCIVVLMWGFGIFCGIIFLAVLGNIVDKFKH